MKNLSKTAWLILSIGIFVIIMGGLYFVYNRQADEQKILNNRLTTAQNTLPPLISEYEDLQSQLNELEGAVAEAESSISQAKLVFPKSVDSIEYDELLFSIAKDWNLIITRLTSSEPEIREVEDIPFLETTFTLEIEGEAPESSLETAAEYNAYIEEAVANILDFIHTMVNDSHFVSATADLVSIRVPDPISEEEKPELTEDLIEAREGTEVPSAIINLVIYSYKGE